MICMRGLCAAAPEQRALLACAAVLGYARLLERLTFCSCSEAIEASAAPKMDGALGLLPVEAGAGMENRRLYRSCTRGHGEATEQ
jgi:hypothetical protein